MADVQSDADDQTPAALSGSAQATRPRLWLAVGLAVALSAHLASAAFHVLFGALNVDEGFMGSRRVPSRRGSYPTAISDIRSRRFFLS